MGCKFSIDVSWSYARPRAKIGNEFTSQQISKIKLQKKKKDSQVKKKFISLFADFRKYPQENANEKKEEKDLGYSRGKTVGRSEPCGWAR